MTHLHITAWVLAFILLIIASRFYSQQNQKPAKIIHMIMRVDLLVIFLTGAHLFAIYNEYTVTLFIKVILGLWTIVALEMVAVGMSKGRSVKSWVIQLVIVSLITIYLGLFQLPMGIYLN